MTKLLIRLFVKDREDRTSPQGRRRYGLFASIVGICCNIILFIAKFSIGIFSGSVSIAADAFNNLSDLGSSVMALIGFKLSAKPADKEHPYGHGRMEYMAGFIVAIAIILVGAELLKTSVQKIFTPQELGLSPVLVVVLVLSIGIKLWMFLFYRKIGKMIHSATVQAASFDSLSDTVSTGAVLLALGISYFTGLHLDAYMGCAVAIFILFSGIKVAKDTLNPLLGQSPDKEFVQELEQAILAYDGIVGVHDLVVHDYGPGRRFASVHAEVPAHIDLLTSHDIIDNCEREVGERFKTEIVIHMDPIVTDDETVNRMRAAVEQTVKSIDPSLSTHDFRMVTGDTHTNLIFDVLADPDFYIKDDQLVALIEDKIKQINGSYFCVITVDHNYTAV